MVRGPPFWGTMAARCLPDEVDMVTDMWMDIQVDLKEEVFIGS
jgi:hypothetical protein